MISLYTLFVTGHAEVPVIDPRLLTHIDVPVADYPSNGPAAIAEEALAIAPDMNSSGQQIPNP